MLEQDQHRAGKSRTGLTRVSESKRGSRGSPSLAHCYVHTTEYICTYSVVMFTAMAVNDKVQATTIPCHHLSSTPRHRMSPQQRALLSLLILLMHSHALILHLGFHCCTHSQAHALTLPPIECRSCPSRLFVRGQQKAAALLHRLVLVAAQSRHLAVRSYLTVRSLQ